MPMVYLHHRPRLFPGSWQNEVLIYSFHESIKTTLLNKLTPVLLIFLLLPLQPQRQPLRKLLVCMEQYSNCYYSI